MNARDDRSGPALEGTEPHSEEAEQAVLGALMLERGALDRCSDVIAASDFYAADHRAIFSTIAGLVAADKVADELTVSEAGGHAIQYLGELTRSTISAASVRHYAQIVRDRALERGLQRWGNLTAQTATDIKRTPLEKIDTAMVGLTRLAEGSAAAESVPLASAMKTFIERLKAEAAGTTRVMQTGLRALDKMLAGGLREGELMVIGGRPKMGKTALVLTLSRNMSRRYGVLLLSQEMPVHELMARNTAAMSDLNLASLRQPDQLTKSNWAAVYAAIGRMESMAMVLDDQRALMLGDVRRKLMAAKRLMAIDVVVVDFLQLMAGSGDNRNQELDRIANGLKALAGEFKVAVILLSQMSREADKRHGPPVMTDLRDSGAIEAAADVIALMYREFAHPLGKHTEEWRHHAQLELVQRNGAPGTIDLRFNGEYQQFSDWDGQAPKRTLLARASVGGGLD